jgi:hypothetical protein
MKKYRYVTCVYEITVDKLGKHTFDYEIENRTLKQRVLSDEELIKLFKNEDTAATISKSKKKREKLKNREIRKNELIANDADDTSDTYDEVNENTNNRVIVEDKIEILDIPLIIPFPSYNSDNEIDLKYEARPNIKFISIDYFTYEDRVFIRKLLNDLYEKNTKYKTYILNNSYTRVMVLKTFHYDKSYIDKSLHFNVLFENIYTKSSVKHVYLKDETIHSITEINNILD